MIQQVLSLFSSSVTTECPDGSGTCSTNLPKVNLDGNEVQHALAIFFGIAAGISVIMVIVGGMMFVTSGGNPQNVQKARETLIYAVVGLIVSLLAEALVVFVLGVIKF